jgi:hypothetical protein
MIMMFLTVVIKQIILPTKLVINVTANASYVDVAINLYPDVVTNTPSR